MCCTMQSTHVPNGTIDLRCMIHSTSGWSVCSLVVVYSVGPTGNWHTGQTVPCTQVLTRTGTGTASVIQVQHVSMHCQN